MDPAPAGSDQPRLARLRGAVIGARLVSGGRLLSGFRVSASSCHEDRVPTLPARVSGDRNPPGDRGTCTSQPFSARQAQRGAVVGSGEAGITRGGGATESWSTTRVTPTV